MAAVSSAPGAAATTFSSHDTNGQRDGSWPMSNANEGVPQENVTNPHTSPSLSQNGFEPLGPPAPRSGRKVQSADTASPDQLSNGTEHEPTDGPKSGSEDYWIHRDKLAKIESEELQAAGFFAPRSRAPSKQRRDRSQASFRRGTDASEHSRTRSRKNSAAVEPRPAQDSSAAWDLRTREEIAEEEANAYFVSSAQTGGSRIPVAKTSVAPLSPGYLERPTPAIRRQNDSSEDVSLSYSKTRSQSAGASGRDALGANGAARRAATDVSPKKPGSVAAARKTTPSKPPPSQTNSTSSGRPKTRSGSNNGTRPSTRSGDKSMEGDPPWMANTYKPDPRLPPDQQLLPTVARRLQQEQWEKDGKFGDTYDTEFRPLNENVFLKPTEPEPEPSAAAGAAATGSEQPQADAEWPLRPEAVVAKSPSLRQGSYSTMPKISDKPPGTPMSTGPRSPMLPQQPMEAQPKPQTQAAKPAQPAKPMETQEPEAEPGAKQKGGCGCCIVM